MNVRIVPPMTFFVSNGLLRPDAFLVEMLFLFLIFLRWAKIFARFTGPLIPLTFQLIKRTAEPPILELLMNDLDIII